MPRALCRRVEKPVSSKAPDRKVVSIKAMVKMPASSSAGSNRLMIHGTSISPAIMKPP